MPASILDLKELPEEKMLFLSFITDSGTGICANMSGNLRNSNLLHVPVAEDVLKPASEKSIRMNYSWNLQNSQ